MNAYAPLLLAAGALALAAALFGAGYLKGKNDGQVDQLKSSVEAYRERSDIDARVRTGSDYQLCLDLGGLPDQCQQLRGMDPAAKGK